MTPSVSVIVPSHQGAARLPALLDALAAQRTGREWEVVVVLDGSTDASADLLAGRARGLPLRIVENPTNRGRPAALNAGYEAASGDVLIRCDDDLLPAPDHVERHARWHDDADDLAVVGLPRNRFEPTPYAETYGRAADERFAATAYRAPEAWRWLYWSANCSLRRDLWDRAGGYADAFVDRGEDWELGYRLHRAGARFVLDPALEIEHRPWAVDVRRRLAHAYLVGVSGRRFEELHGVPCEPPTPPASSVRARAWEVLVALAGTGARPGLYTGAGALLDRVLPVLPRPVAGRLVALGVEGAARAGRRRGA